ncbi:response regulator transcription factor [Flavobacterium salilacus subsp. salilacus]|uniref:response regulator n=1 Tax=Flavobacterium TaxID=237 RepID=UPI001074E63A|nr:MULTISPECIES: response regulator transcription factor [Flavobacterium]KAF2519640.1 response regulator transcription factor [Flavobacterium salilacus subsp. salilacus]MBE1614458.1 response regulator transcription factor [Flavobacterium sp. SaA2.13]
MSQDLNILIVDDHPMTVNGYVNVLSEEKFEGYNLVFTKALNCEDAYNLISKSATDGKPFDIAYLDLSLPPYPDKNIFSGFDLGVLIKNTIPDCIIIILTMHSEASLVDRLIKEINPKGILCKSDIDIDEFLNAFKIIFEKNDTYLSNKIVKSMKDKVFDNYNLDNYDKQILMRLSEGILTKNIPNYVPLSLSAIEKRKARMKNMLLQGQSGDDYELIEAIKKMGVL